MQPHDDFLSGSSSPIDSRTSIYLSALVFAAGALFLVGWFIWLYPHYRRRLQSRRHSASTGLEKSIIKSLPRFNYDGDIKSKDPLDCPICLSEFKVKETVKMIPFCGHFFHPKCIDMWFAGHLSCPLCRSTQLFPSPPGEAKVDSAAPPPLASAAMEEGDDQLSDLRINIGSSDVTAVDVENTECGRLIPRQQETETGTGRGATRMNSLSPSSGLCHEDNRDLVPPRSSSF